MKQTVYLSAVYGIICSQQQIECCIHIPAPPTADMDGNMVLSQSHLDLPPPPPPPPVERGRWGWGGGGGALGTESGKWKVLVGKKWKLESAYEQFGDPPPPPPQREQKMCGSWGRTAASPIHIVLLPLSLQLPKAHRLAAFESACARCHGQARRRALRDRRRLLRSCVQQGIAWLF